ncbi:hypothetical protein CK203_043981 [Vitis vinifera]|uniref:DUF4283 domain-containing protein n=1 Tax=Vitis vinifera TaxID=29760 RepID=A0A438HTH9_VITVI|nr:hypothetical protein CK203_043981 [Vitis vinifera]
MFGINQLSKSRYRGGRSYAEVVAEDGIRSGVPVAAGKWARAVICECKEKVQDWTDEGKAIARKSKMVTRAGEAFSERKACSPKKMVAKRKYVYSWKIQKGLVSVERPSFSLVGGRPTEIHLEEVGEGDGGSKGNREVVDLTKVKLWVEMHPRVVLPALLEVEDGAWKHTVAVSVIGEEGEDGNVTSETSHCRRELLPRARYRRSSTSMAAKRENGWEGSRLGFVEEALISSNPSPPSEIEEESYGRRTVGCKSSGPSGLGQVQGGLDVVWLEIWVSRERKCSKKGESFNGSEGRLHARGKNDGFKGDVVQTLPSKRGSPSWTTGVAARLFPYGAQRHLAKATIWKWMAGWDLIRLEVSGESHLPLSSAKELQQWSKEETSPSRGVVESRKSQLKEDKGGFTSRAGYDPGSSSVTVSPSIQRTRAPEPYSSPSCNLAMNLPCPSGPHLPYSEILSQSPSVNQGKFKIFPEIGDVGPLNFVGIPVHVEEENQRAVFNQMSESSTPGKSSNLMPGSPGVNEASPPEDFLIDGLSPRKMAKVRNKKGEVRQKASGSVWTVRNKEWVFLPVCGASGGILFIWDSKKLSKEEWY